MYVCMYVYKNMSQSERGSGYSKRRTRTNARSMLLHAWHDTYHVAHAPLNDLGIFIYTPYARGHINDIMQVCTFFCSQSILTSHSRALWFSYIFWYSHSMYLFFFVVLWK